MFYSGTSPQQTRLRLLNSEPNQAIILGILYDRPSRVDVYRNNQYVTPQNAALDSSGRQILNLPTSPGQYMPDVTLSHNGANYFDQTEQILYVLVRGGDPVDIRQASMIVVTFKLPAMTVDEFFGEKIVENLALFLGIPSSKIRIAKVVRADGGRRRRAAMTEVTIEIGNEPTNSTDTTPIDYLTQDDLQQATAMIVTGTQMHNLTTDVFENNQVVSVDIMESNPGSGTEAWKEIASAGNVVVTVKVPQEMELIEQPGPLHEGAAFNNQPKLQIINANVSHYIKSNK